MCNVLPRQKMKPKNPRISHKKKKEKKKIPQRLQKLSFTSNIYCYQYSEMFSHRINSMEECYLSKQFISTAQIYIYIYYFLSKFNVLIQN